MPSRTGEYDTIELFTPKNAPWELGESSSVVYSKIYHEPLHSRQQFPEAYAYDGSICILNKKKLEKNAICNPVPIILKKSCIVVDWVDYLYSVTAQKNIVKKQT